MKVEAEVETEKPAKRNTPTTNKKKTTSIKGDENGDKYGFLCSIFSSAGI